MRLLTMIVTSRNIERVRDFTDPVIASLYIFVDVSHYSGQHSKLLSLKKVDSSLYKEESTVYRNSPGMWIHSHIERNPHF